MYLIVSIIIDHRRSQLSLPAPSELLLVLRGRTVEASESTCIIRHATHSPKTTYLRTYLPTYVCMYLLTYVRRRRNEIILA